MRAFSQNLSPYFDLFTPFLAEQAVVFDDCFTKKTQSVADFVKEMQHTALLLSQQTESEYAEIYAEKLLRQFDALKKAVKQIKPANKPATFQSSYHFPRNIHSLPPNKRLHEYRRALRALNEKLSWLIEQHLKTEVLQQKSQFEESIKETEYRKAKCLAAIEKLEEELSFVR